MFKLSSKQLLLNLQLFTVCISVLPPIPSLFRTYTDIETFRDLPHVLSQHFCTPDLIQILLVQTTFVTFYPEAYLNSNVSQNLYLQSNF